MRSYPFRWVLLPSRKSFCSHLVDPSTSMTYCGRSAAGAVVIGVKPRTPCGYCATAAAKLVESGRNIRRE